jgi:flagellar biosynthesis component FlhA
MKNLFTLNRDLWNRLTLSDTTLLSEATLQKLIALTDSLENEVQSEYNLSNELTSDVRMLFTKKVWHCKDEEDFELSIEVMLRLLVESIESECRKYGYSDQEVVSMTQNFKNLVCSVPDSFRVHESKIRAIVVRSYIIDKFLEMGCPEEFVYQIVPSQKEIERRLMIDVLES